MQNRRKPRALTLTLPNAKQPFLVWQGEKYTLRNFSDEGIGLWVQQPASMGLAPGRKMSADVVIGKEIYPVQLEIRHSSPGVIGLKFVEVSGELSRVFRELMAPSTYAATLKPHPQSGTEDPAQGCPRLWYTGDGHSELVVWYNEFQRTVLGLQLVWLGKWIVRSQFGAATTGHLKDGEIPAGGVQIAKTSLLAQHTEPDSELLHQAAQFLTSVPMPLPGALLWQFLELGEQVFLPRELIERARVA